MEKSSQLYSVHSDESLLGEEEYEEESELEVNLEEDLFHKNTKSFQCLTQIEISRSSLLRDPYYWFPDIEDPHLLDALWKDAPKPQYDDIGIQHYIDLCKEENIVPFRRIIHSLEGDFLDLRFYGLGRKAMRTVCETLEYNSKVNTITLQENHLDPESCGYLSNMLLVSMYITNIDLRECRIGVEGAKMLAPGILATKSLEKLDLTYNSLGDDGVRVLAPALKGNVSIHSLNLSHNNLNEGALIALCQVVEENYNLNELDLSWNYFYKAEGMTEFMEALQENASIISLNLAWNGIGEKLNMLPILHYLKSELAILKHLNLSNNRICGISVKMLVAGLKHNEHLVSLNLGYNPMMPEDVNALANLLLEKRETPFALQVLNFDNIWVKKNFIRIRNRCKKKGCTVTYGGIYSNYKIRGPNFKFLLLERAKAVALMPKKKKNKKDIGIFMVTLKDEPIRRSEFLELLHKHKIKLDQDLTETMLTTWECEKKRIDIKGMKETYLKMYPDTKPPEKKKKGKKKKKQPQAVGEEVKPEASPALKQEEIVPKQTEPVPKQPEEEEKEEMVPKEGESVADDTKTDDITDQSTTQDTTEPQKSAVKLPENQPKSEDESQATDMPTTDTETISKSEIQN